MIKENQIKDRRYYQCEACNFFYEEKENAEKCEKWCKENKSCNLEIIRKSIKV